MRLNKYVMTLLFMGVIIIMESVPFFYNEAYTIRDIKWGWVIGFPLVYLIFRLVTEKRNKDK